MAASSHATPPRPEWHCQLCGFGCPWWIGAEWFRFCVRCERLNKLQEKPALRALKKGEEQ
jgi:hypothetical protein